jgi:glutamate-1-semialdehyde 2,1-aminomutase
MFANSTPQLPGPPAPSQKKVDEALHAAQARFAANNALSYEQHRKAAQVMPGGNTRSVLFSDPFPVTLASGHGATVTSLDGKVYTDFLGEFTAGLYGHSDPVLRDAVIKALDGGWVMGGHVLAEERFARLICERFPSIERVRFTNSGTEANLYAMSAARVITGKKKILVFDGGYHGGVFLFSNGKPSQMTVPFDFVVAPYNDIEATLALLEANAAEIGTLVVEQMQGSGGCIPGDHDFLRMLREWATDHQALLIFDEVMTSRLSPGGLQALTGIIPDLTTIGKYVGGGFGFGAFGGRTDLMERFNPQRADALAHAGTFNNNVFTMSVGAAGLSQVYTPKAAIELNARGDELRNRLNAVAERAVFPMQFTGLGSMMNVHMCEGPIRSVQDLKLSDYSLRHLFYFDLLHSGIWLAARGMINLSLATGDAECEKLVQAVESFVEERNALFDDS